MITKVIFISIDTLRYDCIGYQPDKRELIKHDVLKYLDTPTLDSIAEKSLCFTQCISTNTYTTASHASIFTGLYPPKHGVRAFYDTKLSNEVLTIAEVFKRNGYKTILHTDSPELFVPLGLNRDFDFELTRNDERLFSLLKSLQDEKQRIFLFCHFMDVHEPFLHNTNRFRPKINDDYLDELLKLYKEFGLLDYYERDDTKAELWNRLMGGPLRHRPIDILLPLYVRGVTKFDKERFRYLVNNLERMDFLNNALVVIFSDHGEGRYHHEDKGYFSHGGNLYDNVLRVPLLIKHPDLNPGINNKLISTVDIFPTVLSILNTNIDSQNIDGINILSDNREMSYAEFWANQSGITSTPDGLKPIYGKWPESMLTQMAVRTVTHKFVKWNKGKTEEFHNEEVFRLSNSEYVKKLYRDILGKFEDPKGLQYYVDLLDTGLKTKREMLTDFLSLEKLIPKLAVYNLKNDFEEDCPIDASQNLDSQARIYFDYIEKLNSQAIVTEKIFEEKEQPDISKPEGRFIEITEDKTILFKSLEEKERWSMEVIKKAVELYGIDSIGIAWTGGKDSTTVLHLIRQAFGGHIPFKVINIDTSVKFPEIYAFRDRIQKEWGLDLRIFRNEEASKWIKESKDHAECCYQLKTVPLNKAIESLGLKVLITGLRWDEQEARADEKYYSPREKPAHIRVQPILHFREVDIWQYIKKYNVPYCQLYNKGYRSLGCAPCTDLSSGKHERSGRAQDKEKIMAKLRELGYF